MKTQQIRIRKSTLRRLKSYFSAIRKETSANYFERLSKYLISKCELCNNEEAQECSIDGSSEKIKVCDDCYNEARE